MSAEVIVLDIRGQVCPSCLLLTLREINKHHDDLIAGRVRLIVYIDSRDATGTIPEAVRNMGLNVAVEKRDAYYQVAIERPEKPL